jgi:2-(1,2-epoxy-1,2-dihydrophenyl)acetyl-CoA isomerase
VTAPAQLTSVDLGDLLLEVEGGVARITLNRPQAANSITATQRNQIIDWIEAANDDAFIRCIVLGANGKHFCTGADLRQEGAKPPRPEGAPEQLVGDRRRVMLQGAIRLVSSILDSEKPVIAAVQGTAAGIGCHIAFACDLVIASDSAKFIEVFARRGLTADGLGTWLLPRLIGLQRARELILLAEDVSPQRAAEIGLITRCVPADEFDATVADLAARLANGPTKAHTVNKWLLNRSFDMDRSTLAQAESWIVDIMSNTHDAGEGVASFVERREPRYRGF